MSKIIVALAFIIVIAVAISFHISNVKANEKIKSEYEAVIMVLENRLKSYQNSAAKNGQHAEIIQAEYLQLKSKYDKLISILNK